MNERTTANYTCLLSLSLLLGASLFSSCTLDSEPLPSPIPDEDRVEMIIQAGLPETKTENDGNKTLWVEGDSLSVFHSASDSSCFTVDPFVYSEGNSFKGTVGNISKANDWYVVYPYSDNHVAPEEIHFTFSSTQIQDGNDNTSHLAGPSFPMYGQAEDVARDESLAISMTNILSVARFRVVNTTDSPIVVTKVSFTAPSPIAGEFFFDLTKGYTCAGDEREVMETVALTVENGKEIPADDEACFYAAVAPFDVEAGGQISVEVTAFHTSGPDSEISFNKTYTLENGTSFTSGHIKSIKVPFEDTFVDLGTFNLENDSLSAYLDLAEEQYTDDNYTKTSVVADFSKTASNYNRLDIPKPVSIEWEQKSSGTTTVSIYADKALSDIVWEQTTTSGSMSDDVYNLIPGRKYYYTVVDDSGIISKGTFKTTGRRRMIKVSDTASENNANNCRDLGGLKTTDGHVIKYGWIYRGTNLNNTSDDEKKYLVECLNVGWDNDLREDGNTVNVFENSIYDVAYVAPGYMWYIDDLTVREKVKVTMQAFIDAAKAGKATYFHCRIGSDRTGYWALLIEGLLGVSAKDCSIDYEMTSFAKNVTDGNRERNKSSQLFYQGMDFFSEKTGSTLQEKINNYLVNEVGITQSDIDNFKSIVLE